MFYGDYLTPQTTSLKDAFLRRGWQVEEVGSRQAPLVKVRRGAKFGCGDGRNPDLGPALFGSFWGVMATLTGGESLGAERAKIAIRDLGYQPTIHGDEHGEFACGFFEKWIRGELPGVYQPNFNQNELPHILDRVMRVRYRDKHQERELWLNPVSSTTIRPDTRRFRVDLWFGEALGIPRESLIDTSIIVVELLSQVRTAKIIVPA